MLEEIEHQGDYPAGDNPSFAQCSDAVKRILSPDQWDTVA